MLTLRWGSSRPEPSDTGLTYPEVGATRDARLPEGYNHVRHRVRLGHGREVFDHAVHQLRTFGVHRGAGLSVSPDGATAVDGQVVVVSLDIGPFRLFAACKVVWTVDSEVRGGFAYGTLPGHEECGEESFVAEIDGQGEVWFTVTAFSRPATRLARLGGPVSRSVQRLITNRYLRALALKPC